MGVVVVILVVVVVVVYRGNADNYRDNADLKSPSNKPEWRGRLSLTKRMRKAVKGEDEREKSGKE